MKNRRVDLVCENCKVQEISRFKHLNAKDLDDMTQSKTCTAYKKGQVLFHEGTRPLGVFCVHAGKIKIYKTGYDGKDQIIQITKPGDLIGYKAMISEEMYPVSAETLEDATVCFIPRTDFLSVLDASSQLNRILLKEACQELGVMTESLTNLAQKPVRERLAVTLLMLKDTYGIDAVDNGEVEINLTREDLANTVGTATETLIRLLHDFKEEKLIESKGRKIRVIDDRGLFKVANVY
jgi:CRP/FNR family transcriptional regulator